jgi:phenylpyruvate tautomerase PptA (4-oxalocrotonate tautomerase family)
MPVLEKVEAENWMVDGRKLKRETRKKNQEATKVKNKNSELGF